ncbi:MAG: GIY-YIG nuclease family protein [Desulfobacteraceae bacterium]|jgi:Uri superfamily endonuclease
MPFPLKELQSVNPNVTPFPNLYKGTYILVLRLAKATALSIGKLGHFDFKKGYYLYVGSAFGPGGLASRLKHHLSVSPKPRWHLDYLRPATTITDIRISDENERAEHIWATHLSLMENFSIPIPGFGSSDCHCLAHLFHSPKKPVFFMLPNPMVSP